MARVKYVVIYPRPTDVWLKYSDAEGLRLSGAAFALVLPRRKEVILAAMKITLAALLLLGAVLAAPPLFGYGTIVSYEHAVRRNFIYKNGKLLSTVLARQASARTEGCIEGWGIIIFQY